MRRRASQLSRVPVEIKGRREMALTAEENERLTRVGPGTPMGRLLRWYWHPIAASAQLLENPVRKVRILGEDLVLYRDRGGRLGLIGDRCAHRATGLQYGIPDEEGLRCPYHGWRYDGRGQCTDQPLEPPGSMFKERIRITGYPVEELGGLIWAYLGEAPAPLLPRWDQFERPNTFRHIAGTMLPCNWLQCLENGGDPRHGAYLHGHFYRYVIERMQAEGKEVTEEAIRFAFENDYGFQEFRELRVERFPYGQRKWVNHAPPGEEPRWLEHTIVVFPYMRGGQIGVPVDDTHTWHIIYMTYTPKSSIDVPDPEVVPYFEAPFADERGEPLFDYITAQDHMAWWSQGDITDRTKEHLAYTDMAVVGYRQLLKEQMDIVVEGGEPMNIFHDPASNVRLDHGPARYPWARSLADRETPSSQPRFAADTAQFSPVYRQLLDLYHTDQEVLARRRETSSDDGEEKIRRR
ncbi:MAG: Rieske 2Fe-2S domain-containing protein [Chloroflexi bacterium]|nr:Rieske 2Fe-2S domain-containing protein [Chloroflexota bacterium]